jgi:hypothetical protein
VDPRTRTPRRSSHPSDAAPPNGRWPKSRGESRAVPLQPGACTPWVAPGVKNRSCGRIRVPGYDARLRGACVQARHVGSAVAPGPAATMWALRTRVNDREARVRTCTCPRVCEKRVVYARWPGRLARVDEPVTAPHQGHAGISPHSVMVPEVIYRRRPFVRLSSAADSAA